MENMNNFYRMVSISFFIRNQTSYFLPNHSQKIKEIPFLFSNFIFTGFLGRDIQIKITMYVNERNQTTIHLVPNLENEIYIMQREYNN